MLFRRRFRATLLVLAACAALSSPTSASLAEPVPDPLKTAVESGFQREETPRFVFYYRERGPAAPFIEMAEAFIDLIQERFIPVASGVRMKCSALARCG